MDGSWQPTRRVPKKHPYRSRGALALALAVCASGPWLGCVRPDPGTSHDALVVLLPRDPLDFDPRFVSDPYGLKISRLIFASLVRIDPLRLDAVPDLAERIELIGDRLYRVYLRPQLKFSDGSALDSADVVATYRGILDPKLLSRYAATYARISRVEALDPLTVEFELSGPHATFMTDLELPIVRAEDGHRRIAIGSGERPIGAGPYRLARREYGKIELLANPHWYRGAPNHPRVRMLVVRDDNTRALRMLAGAGDLAINAVPAGLIPLFQPSDGFEVATAPGIGTTYLGVNTSAPSVRDARVRRALAHAIDRQALIAAKLGGRADLARSFIPPGHWAYEAATRSYDFDPARAKAILDDIGLTANDGRPRLHLTLRCGSDRGPTSIARAIVAMLADVDIQVDLMPTEVATLIADLNRGHFELTLMQMPELIEPHVLSWFFSRDRIPGDGREGANRWRFDDARLEVALERGRSQVDREARKAAYAEAQRVLADALPVIPLWHEDVVAVRGVGGRGIDVPRDGRYSTLAR